MAVLLLQIVLAAAALVLAALCLVWCIIAVGALRQSLFVRGLSDDERGPSAFAGPALVTRETITAVRMIWWSMWHRGKEHRLGDAKDNLRPVILVHGIAADGSNFWAMRARLIHEGRATYAPNMGRPFRPFEAYVPPLLRAFESALAEHPESTQVDVVCHSMGGIILRVLLRDHPEWASKIHAIVTIASPHRGTGSAYKFPGPEPLRLRYNAPFLQELPSLRALAPDARITTIAAPQDQVVYPSTTSHIVDAAAHDVSGIGHGALLTDPRVYDVVVAAITDAGVLPQ